MMGPIELPTRSPLANSRTALHGTGRKAMNTAVAAKEMAPSNTFLMIRRWDSRVDQQQEHGEQHHAGSGTEVAAIYRYGSD